MRETKELTPVVSKRPEHTEPGRDFVGRTPLGSTHDSDTVANVLRLRIVILAGCFVWGSFALMDWVV